MLYFFRKNKPILPKSIINCDINRYVRCLPFNKSRSSGLSAEAGAGIMAIFLALLCWGYGSIFVAKADLPKVFLKH
jgi:hypothetical protein